ncbi:calphotin-like [Leguminivora glycinivorella]|uniref:calphotin-like n=1 Tax=Leguminivora glycinivorella TaxID=1035111 RepID=UPI00200FA0C4|nr:calphotin-like [Leguminivora glycinivorella]
MSIYIRYRFVVGQLDTVATKMKYLLAFALVAVAAALPEPVQLAQPAPPQLTPLVIQPAAAPVFVDAPAAVESVKIADAPIEAIPADFTVNFVDVAPEVADAPVEAVPADFAVNFVDAAPEVADTPVEAVPAGSAVNFVDVAPEAPAQDFVVKFVDTADVAAEIAEAPVENFAVRFIDNAIDEETPSYIPMEVPFQVQIVPMPALPGSLVQPLVGFVEVVREPMNIDVPEQSNDNAVKFVDVAPEAPVINNMFPQRYPNPMWR